MRAGLDIGETEIIQQLSLPIRLIVLAVAAASIAPSMPAAYAGFRLDGGSSVAVLYEGNGGKHLQYNNSNVSGDVGIGGLGQVRLSGPGAINLDFSGTGNAANCSSPCGVVGGVTTAGAISSSVSPVSSALTDLNSLSQTLGEETGAALTISSRGLVNASSGKLDSSGNEVFSLKAASSFPSGTFTINSTASQMVVVNVPRAVGNLAFSGSLVFTRGLASDQVLFNFDQGNYGTFSGGATGTFLDPNGNIPINHSVLDGRIFAGGSQNSAIVSGANISFVPPASSATVPASLTLLGMALAGIAVALIRRWRRARLY
jgi:choice-of-anchor A domain-containing protein